MLIKRSVPRKLPPLPSEAKELLALLTTLREDELATLLSTVECWNWPKVDLFHFIPALNRLDAVLERLIAEYGLQRGPAIQSREFDDHDRVLLLEILRFEKILLEHSTNRRLFQSVDRLDCLLYTTDLQVLEYTLRLLLRPAQHQSIRLLQTSHSSNGGSRRIQDKLFTLASAWQLQGHSSSAPSKSHHMPRKPLSSASSPNGPLSMLDLVQADTFIDAKEAEVEWHFYQRLGPRDLSSKHARTVDSAVAIQSTSDLDPPQTSQPACSSSSSRRPDESPASSTHRANQNSQNEGLTTIRITSRQMRDRSVGEIMRDVVRWNTIPAEALLDLQHRIQISRASQQVDLRSRLLQVRLLATAILAHLLCDEVDTQAAGRITLYEPELIGHIADLLDQTSASIDDEILACAFNALDGLARMKGHLSTVLSSINANVNHGRLMTSISRLAETISESEVSPNLNLVDAIINLVSYLFTSGSGGQMLIQAGILPIMISIVKVKGRLIRRIVSRIVHTIDTVIHSFQSGFTAFITAKGLETAVDRAKSEVETLQLREIAPDENASVERSVELIHFGRIDYSQGAVLKSLLRLLQRMLNSSNNADGLRGLFDTSLPPTLRSIIEDSSIYGSIVFANAVSLFATLVHQEPTALPIYMETGLPQSLLTVLSGNIDPHSEILSAIPNALGAIGLHENGLKLVLASSVIERLLEVFLNTRHLEVLLEKEHSAHFGAQIDELIRHHPSLQQRVFRAIFNTFDRILALEHEHPIRSSDTYCKLLRFDHLNTSTETEEAVAAPIQAQKLDVPTLDRGAAPSGKFSTHESSLYKDEKAQDCFVARTIDAFGRFLEGFLQQSSHCGAFVEEGGLARICLLYKLPILPYDFCGTSASDTLVALLRMIGESNSTRVVNELGKTLQAILENLGDHIGLEADTQALNLYQYISTDDGIAVKGNKIISSLISIHAVCNALCEIFSHFSQASGRSSSPVLTALSQDTQIKQLGLLGNLHRKLIWENAVLQRQMPQSWVDHAMMTSKSAPQSTSSLYVRELQGLSRSGTPTPETRTDDWASSRFHNARLLKYITSQLPNSLTMLCLNIIKHFSNNRRQADQSQESATKIAKSLNNILQYHISWDAPTEDESCFLAYASVMFSFCYVLLVDSGKPALHTLVLREFVDAHGIDRVEALLKRLSSAHGLQTVATTDDSPTAKACRVHCETGMQVIGEFLQCITSSKILHESPQTAALLSIAEKHSKETSHFEVGKFLADLRYQAIPAIIIAWKSQWMQTLPAIITKGYVHAAAHTLAGEGESSHLDVRSPLALPTSIRASGSTPHDSRADYVQTSNAATLRSTLSTGLDVEQTNSARLGSSQHEQLGEQEAIHPLLDQDIERQKPASTIDSLARTDRQALLQQLTNQLTMSLTRKHNDLLFDLKILYHLPSNKSRELQNQLLAAIKRGFDEENITSEPIGVSDLARLLRLLALLLHDEDALKSLRPLLFDIQTLLSDGIRLSLPRIGKHSEQMPSWLPPLLLSTEVLVRLYENAPICDWPDRSRRPSAPEATQAQQVCLPQLSTLCLKTLSHTLIDKDNLGLVLKLLIFITKRHENALDFLIDGFAETMTAIAGSVSKIKGLQAFVAILLRHILETDQHLESVMLHQMEVWLARPNKAAAELDQFSRTFSSSYLRSPAIFMRCCRRRIRLARRTPGSSVLNVLLKEESIENASQDLQNPSHLQHDKYDMETCSFKLMEGLATELISGPKIDSIDTKAAAIQDDTSKDIAEAIPKAFVENEHPAFMYRCFVLQMITELVLWSPSCKESLMKHKIHIRSKSTHILESESLFSYILHHLVPYGCLTPTEDTEMRKKVGQANWAIVLIVALCTETRQARHDAPKNGLISTRRAVLDAIAKSLKDAIASDDPFELRYGKVFALADLSYRLLVMKPPKDPGSDGTSPQVQDQGVDMAKNMLEKGFVPILTSALAHIDMNFPSIQFLITAVLKPLDILTKLSHKMSKPGSSEATKSSLTDDAAIDGVNHNIDDQDQSREGTPDLYRHSALGMYRGELEHSESDDDTGSSELSDVYPEEDYEDEMSDSEASNTDESHSRSDHGEMDIEVVMPYDAEDHETSGTSDQSMEDSLSSNGSETGSVSGDRSSSEWVDEPLTALSEAPSEGTGLRMQTSEGFVDIGSTVDQAEAVEDELLGLNDEGYDDDDNDDDEDEDENTSDPYEDELMEIEDQAAFDPRRDSSALEIGWPDIGNDLSMGNQGIDLDQRLFGNRARHGIFYGRTHRNGLTATIGTHGLLAPDLSTSDPVAPPARHTSNGNFTHHMHSIERLVGDSAQNALEILDHLLQRTTHRDGPIRVEVISSPALPHERHQNRDEMNVNNDRQHPHSSDPVMAVQDFSPTSSERWQQEAMMISEHEGNQTEVANRLSAIVAHALWDTIKVGTNQSSSSIAEPFEMTSDQRSAVTARPSGSVE